MMKTNSLKNILYFAWNLRFNNDLDLLGPESEVCTFTQVTKQELLRRVCWWNRELIAPSGLSIFGNSSSPISSTYICTIVCLPIYDILPKCGPGLFGDAKNPFYLQLGIMVDKSFFQDFLNK